MVFRKCCDTDIFRNSHQAKYKKNVYKGLQRLIIGKILSLITQFFKHSLRICQMQITYNFQLDFMLQTIQHLLPIATIHLYFLLLHCHLKNLPQSKITSM